MVQSDIKNRNTYDKKYYEKNKDKIKANVKKYNETHKDYIKTRKKEYHEIHKINIKAKQKIYREKHKEQTKNRILKRLDKNMEWFLSFLGTTLLHCSECGYSKSFAALQIHHTNPNQKESNIDHFSYWVRKMKLKTFQDKILKTDFVILCANCHAELHENMKKNGK